MAAQLKIYTLGGHRFLLGGEAFGRLSTRKVEALATYLACTERPQPREVLADLLWDDRSQSRALSNLRVALSNLRKHLGPFFSITRASAGLNLDADVWLDVAELESLLAGGREDGASIDRKGVDFVEKIEAAATLYKGEFLQGFHIRGARGFEEWVTVERERLHQLTLDGLRKVVAWHLEKANYSTGIVLAQHWLQLDPFDEAAHQQMIRLLAYNGQPGAALNQCQECLRLLGEELGVPPSAETKLLHEAIQAGSLAPPERVSWPEPLVPGEQEVSPTFLSQETPSTPLPPEPFIGREKELDYLGENIQAARNRQGRVVFITGDAGQGKTTLLREFSKRAQAAHSDLIVALGTCPFHTGAGAPYVAFREILGMLLGDIEVALAAGAINREHALRLWRLFPEVLRVLLQHGPNLVNTFIAGEELRSRAEAASASQDLLNHLDELTERYATVGHLPTDQSELFVAFASVLEALAARWPLLLVLDDLQWANQSSVSLLAHLSHILPHSAILLVGAYRPEDVGHQAGKRREHPLISVLSEFKRRYGEIRIDLSQDDLGSERRFVDELLDAEPNQLDEGFRKTLVRHTGGHPLFTVELLRELREHGALRRDEEGRWIQGSNLTWDLLPQRVEGVLESRIGRLDRELQRWLAVASIEGQRFTAEVIASVEAADERVVMQRLSGELDRQHHLIRAEGVSRLQTRRLSRYRFLHHIFQRYLYDQMDEVERTYLHERVGLALEALYSDQTVTIAGKLARHFTEAWILDKAIDYWLQAGERAVQVAAHQEAIDDLSRGLELLNNLPTTPTTLRKELSFRIALGFPYIALKGWAAPEVGETYSRALELCEQIGDIRHRFLVNWNLWRFYTNRGELKTAGQLATQMMSRAQDEQNDSFLLQAHHAYWTSRFYTGDLGSVQHHCEQGLAIYNRDRHSEHIFIYGGHDPAICGRCYLAFALWYLGYPDQALTCINDAIRMANELSHPYTRAYALDFAIDIHLFRREVETVHTKAGDVIDFAADNGFSSWVSWGMIRRGWALAHQGQSDQGIALMEQGLEMSESEGQVLFRPYQLALLAEIYTMARMTGEGLMLLDEALAEIDKTGERHYEAEVNRLKGELLLAQGATPEAAEELFHNAIAIARQQTARSWELRSTLSLARLWREQGRRKEAREALIGVFEWFTEGLDTNDLVEARTLLKELS